VRGCVQRPFRAATGTEGGWGVAPAGSRDTASTDLLQHLPAMRCLRSLARPSSCVGLHSAGVRAMAGGMTGGGTKRAIKPSGTCAWRGQGASQRGRWAGGWGWRGRMGWRWPMETRWGTAPGPLRSVAPGRQERAICSGQGHRCWRPGWLSPKGAEMGGGGLLLMGLGTWASNAGGRDRATVPGIPPCQLTHTAAPGGFPPPPGSRCRWGDPHGAHARRMRAAWRGAGMLVADRAFQRIGRGVRGGVHARPRHKAGAPGERPGQCGRGHGGGSGGG
jgi:hypothetical protein